MPIPLAAAGLAARALAAKAVKQGAKAIKVIRENPAGVAREAAKAAEGTAIRSGAATLTQNREERIVRVLSGEKARVKARLKLQRDR